jgi:SAM-dependent methyltransferase
MLPHEAEEAPAFNQRIEERVRAGFVPDLRRAVRCEYFYKSFWRDPQFVRLYLGDMVATYLRMLRQYGGSALKILDVGCGAGYISLELARAGHHVVGIDVARSCIDVARKTLASNTFTDGFGSLEYRVAPFRTMEGPFDVVLFSGALHHFEDPGNEVARAREMLSADGFVLCYEPCHEQWRLEDAAQVALMRMLLSLTGHWYEPFIDSDVYRSDEQFAAFIRDVHVEYSTEQDKNERGQSPHDNSSTGDEILAALREHLVELEYKAGVSFIYRLLGGLRGPDDVVAALAECLSRYDRIAVDSGFMRPNGFFFVGRRR